jgi:hypothetical protein
MLYERYADKKPIMLFDVQEQRLGGHATPAFNRHRKTGN